MALSSQLRAPFPGFLARKNLVFPVWSWAFLELGFAILRCLRKRFQRYACLKWWWKIMLCIPWDRIRKKSPTKLPKGAINENNWLLISLVVEPTHLENMFLKMDHFPREVGVKIPKICELPPPSHQFPKKKKHPSLISPQRQRRNMRRKPTFIPPPVPAKQWSSSGVAYPPWNWQKAS